MSKESDFIAALRALPLHPGAQGLEDDAAVLELGSETLIITHDMMAEGVHWLASQDMTDIAWKLVAVNLSDLAAKGAEPVGVLLGHMLGSDDDRFLSGLNDVLNAYDVPLLGGDTISGDGARTLGLTAIGRATHTPVPSRQGAGEGDTIYVSGPLGAAMLGFEAVRDGTGNESSAFLRPSPLLEEGQALAPHASAMMDISDGLLLDATRMAETSRATFAIDSASVPIATPEERRADALRWGDDYQLLFTAPANAHLPVDAHAIGVVLGASQTPLLVDGLPPAKDDRTGYQHG